MALFLESGETSFEYRAALLAIEKLGIVPQGKKSSLRGKKESLARRLARNFKEVAEQRRKWARRALEMEATRQKFAAAWILTGEAPLGRLFHLDGPEGAEPDPGEELEREIRSLYVHDEPTPADQKRAAIDAILERDRWWREQTGKS